MSIYQLKLNQIVDHPRRRISRQFIRTLMEDRSIRMGGCSGLFYFAILCSFANTQNTTVQIEKRSFKVSAGEHIFSGDELMSWFQTKNRDEAFAILDDFHGYDLIDYDPLSYNGYYKYKILHWSECNTAYELCPPCEAESDFFFISMSALYETFYYREFSEADILLDLWMNANYGKLEGYELDAAPAVHVRNDEGKLIMKYDSLTLQWDLPITRIQAILLKFEKLGYITVLTPHFPSSGLLICLQGFLATAFHISDLMIDKDDWPMSLRVRIELPDGL